MGYLRHGKTGQTFSWDFTKDKVCLTNKEGYEISINKDSIKLKRYPPQKSNIITIHDSNITIVVQVI